MPTLFNKKIWLIAFILIAGYWGYQHWFSPTQIALLNYQDFQIARLAKAKPNDWIKLKKITLDELDELDHYDLTLVFGRGFALNDQQLSDLKSSINNGAKIYIESATNPEMDITTIQQPLRDQISGFMRNAIATNYSNLLRLVRQEIDEKIWQAESAGELIKIDSDVLFHIDESKVFTQVSDYENYYSSLPTYPANGKKIALLTSVPGPFNANRDHLDALINELEQQGLQVYPIASRSRRLELLQRIQPDAVIMMPHGRLQTGRSKQVRKWLSDNAIPLLSPLSVFEKHDDWLNDPQGYSGAMLTMNVVLPELDGATSPYVINAQYPDERGYLIFKAIPERMQKFVQLLKKMLALKSKSNIDKKIGIVYFRGPGKNALVAGGMEVAPSLFNTLQSLKKQGYDLGDLPDNYTKFEAQLNRQGPVLVPFAQGMINTFFETGKPELISAERYQKWCLSLGVLCQKMEAAYGAAPGNYMVTGSQEIAVARLQYGNISILPQPLPGVGKDTFKLVHGTNKAPPHNYAAAYLWLRHGFKADAVIHYGTHGSLEFTPAKQVALSANDWADALLGGTPHFYVYTMANVGEAIIAKRRSYATIVNHLTPPFQEAGLYSEWKTLADKVAEYQTSKGAVRSELQKQIAVLLKGDNRYQDLQLKLDQLRPSEQWEQTVLMPLSRWLETLGQAKILEGLYTLGAPYNSEQAARTARLMSVDALAQAWLDIQQITHPDDAPEQVRPALRQQAAQWINRRLAGESSQSLLEEMLAKPVRERIQHWYNSQAHNTQRGKTAHPHAQKHPGQIKPSGASVKSTYNNPRQLSDALQKEQRLAQAYAKLTAVLQQLTVFEAQLLSGSEIEQQSMIKALAGAYIKPASGGDPIVNPLALPTGRNMYSIDAEKTPTEAAWKVGQDMAKALLKSHLEAQGKYPEKVSFTLWPNSFIQSQGATIAEIFYLLGVEPVRDNFGRVQTLRLIPAQKLGRPRIDVVMQSAGQFRDIAASRLALLEQAVMMSAKAEDDELYENFVAKGVDDAEQYLLERGVSPLRARSLAGKRSFGGLNGAYGTAIMTMVEGNDDWNNGDDIARQYLNNMGANYGGTETWGEYEPHLFAAALLNTEVVAQPRSSNTWGALSLDHVYEFMGGLNNAVRLVTGSDPAAYFNDFRDPGRARVTSFQETVWTEMRTTLLNPKYIKALQKGSASSAETFAETFRNSFGWNAMKPDGFDDTFWNSLYKVYVEDSEQLDLRQFFEQENPYALQEMTGVMLETARRGYWSASDKQLGQLAKLHAELVKSFELGGGDFSGANTKLAAFIEKHLSEAEAKAFRDSFETLRGNNGEQKNLVLKKQEKSSEQQKNNRIDESTVKEKSNQAKEQNQPLMDIVSPLWLFIAAALAGLFLWWRRARV